MTTMQALPQRVPGAALAAENLRLVRTRLQVAAVQAEADYNASVKRYINAAIAHAVAPALWAPEAAEALRQAAIVNDVAVARWTAIRSRLAQLPAKEAVHA